MKKGDIVKAIRGTRVGKQGKLIKFDGEKWLVLFPCGERRYKGDNLVLLSANKPEDAKVAERRAVSQKEIPSKNAPVPPPKSLKPSKKVQTPPTPPLRSQKPSVDIPIKKTSSSDTFPLKKKIRHNTDKLADPQTVVIEGWSHVRPNHDFMSSNANAGQDGVIEQEWKKRWFVLRRNGCLEYYALKPHLLASTLQHFDDENSNDEECRRLIESSRGLPLRFSWVTFETECLETVQFSRFDCGVQDQFKDVTDFDKNPRVFAMRTSKNGWVYAHFYLGDGRKNAEKRVKIWVDAVNELVTQLQQDWNSDSQIPQIDPKTRFTQFNEKKPITSSAIGNLKKASLKTSKSLKKIGKQASGFFKNLSKKI
eukprot:g2815.t1